VRGTILRDIGKGVPANKSAYGGTASSYEQVDPAALKRQDAGSYHAPNLDACWAANPTAKAQARAQL